MHHSKGGAAVGGGIVGSSEVRARQPQGGGAKRRYKDLSVWRIPAPGETLMTTTTTLLLRRRRTTAAMMQGLDFV